MDNFFHVLITCTWPFISTAPDCSFLTSLLQGLHSFHIYLLYALPSPACSFPPHRHPSHYCILVTLLIIAILHLYCSSCILVVVLANIKVAYCKSSNNLMPEWYFSFVGDVEMHVPSANLSDCSFFPC